MYLFSAVIGLVTFVGAYNLLPLDWISFNQKEPNLGATITTILGSDTLSASRSVINTNFLNLNTDKIEATVTSLPNLTTANALSSASSLATVGTITSGTWNATDIAVAAGGTGRSTLTSGALLYGLGTSNVGLLGPCSDNESVLFLSNLPTCSAISIDVSDDFTWTGAHLWQTASSTFSRGLTIGFSTTTTATSTTAFYSPIARFLTYATTTDLFVSGNCTGCSSAQYTASSTNYSVNNGTITYTGSIPAAANISTITYTIVEGGSNDEKGQFNVMRAGLTSFSQDNGKTSGEVNRCEYSFSWSSNNLAVQEAADSDGDCSISGTAYWYK